MNERDFIYWLQGMLENIETETLNEKQVISIKNHLSLVMVKVTPVVYPSTSPGISTFPCPLDTTVIC